MNIIKKDKLVLDINLYDTKCAKTITMSDSFQESRFKRGNDDQYADCKPKFWVLYCLKSHFVVVLSVSLLDHFSLVSVRAHNFALHWQAVNRAEPMCVVLLSHGEN